MAQITKSPLSSSANNIVNFNSPSASIAKTKGSFNSFLGTMSRETKFLVSNPLPKKEKIAKLSNLNIASTFGNAGNLLSSLASGALNVAGFVGNFFGGGGKPKVKPQKPMVQGGKLKFGGIKALGIANALFAGLDFATGLQEGESVGKSAAGAGGALAGSLLGGVIGQTLIPVPGLGFVIGSMAGNFLGGYAADRVYESATGSGGDVNSKEKDKLKQKEREQRARAAAVGKLTLPEVMNKFDGVVAQFDRLSKNIASGSFDESSVSTEWEQGEMKDDKVDYRDPDAKEFTTTGTGEEVFPLVGGRPSITSKGGSFNASRDGGKRKHNAQDIGVDPNTPVVASRSGIVLDSYSSGYGAVGGAVIIKYDNGQQGLYGHTKPNVKPGDKVKAGDKIATVAPDGGNTHLHYMRKDTRGNYIDPLPYLQSSKSGVPKVQPKKEESKKDLQKQSQFSKDSGDMQKKEGKKQQPTVTPKTPTVPTVKPQSTTQTLPETKASTSGTQSSKDTLMSMISAVSTQSQQLTGPSEISQYTTYNQPTVVGKSGQSVIVPIMMGSGGSQEQPSQSPAPSAPPQQNSVNNTGPSPSELLNTFISTALLTNLSSS
jgi:murein DD-endopeptidase MepM/ murein hydrolase activator NlpD